MTWHYSPFFQFTLSILVISLMKSRKTRCGWRHASLKTRLRLETRFSEDTFHCRHLTFVRYTEICSSIGVRSQLPYCQIRKASQFLSHQLLSSGHYSDHDFRMLEAFVTAIRLVRICLQSAEGGHDFILPVTVSVCSSGTRPVLYTEVPRL